MEIARQLQGINLPINIEFIFFSAEEAGMQGSTYFVSQLTQKEKDNLLGCINLDVVGEKGDDNKVVLKTYFGQINILSILMDEYHEFYQLYSGASDHLSFFMGGIPAICFADENVNVHDVSDDPMNEINLNKLKELTNIICEFILGFNLDNYNNRLKVSYTKEYTNLPDTEKVLGYSLVQVNKILKDNQAFSDNQYILKNDKGNQVVITEKDSRFLNDQMREEIQTFDIYNDHIKFKILEEDNKTIIKYIDYIFLKYFELEGKILEERALELLNNDKFISIVNLTNMNYFE